MYYHWSGIVLLERNRGSQSLVFFLWQQMANASGKCQAELGRLQPSSAVILYLQIQCLWMWRLHFFKTKSELFIFKAIGVSSLYIVLVYFINCAKKCVFEPTAKPPSWNRPIIFNIELRGLLSSIEVKFSIMPLKSGLPFVSYKLKSHTLKYVELFNSSTGTGRWSGLKTAVGCIYLNSN